MTTSTNPEERSNKNDFGLIEIKIFKPDDKSSLTIFPEEGDNSRYLFKNMQINEGMFEPAVNGTIVIDGSHPMVDEFNIVGNERIHIEMFTPGIDNSTHSLDFFIHDIYHIEEPVSEAESSVADSANQKNKNITLEFTSYQYYYLNSTDNVHDALRISDPVDQIIDSFKEMLGLPSSSAEDYIGNISELVEIFAGKYFNLYSQEDMYIEDTTNGVWLRPEHSMYPWSKPRNSMSLINLLTNLSENSVSKKNPFAVNYLFWQDLKRWNFRSIDSLIRKDPDNLIEQIVDSLGLGNQKITYDVSGQSTGVDSLLQFSPISESNHLELQNKGAYKSYYEVTKPDYSDPYHDFVDFSSSHTNKRVGYSYFKDRDKWKHVGEHSLLPDDIEDKIGAVRKHDNIYGYFSSEYNNPTTKSRDIMGEISPKGETKLWQTAFDQTDLDLGIAKTIHKTIKEEAEKKYSDYLEKKNLRDRWDTYECSVCCLSGGGPTDEKQSSGAILAGGAFTDVVNYDVSELGNGYNGLALSYDLDNEDSEWNQTIGEFFNLVDTLEETTKPWTFGGFVSRLEDLITQYSNFLDIAENSPCNHCYKFESNYDGGYYYNCDAVDCRIGGCGCLPAEYYGQIQWQTWFQKEDCAGLDCPDYSMQWGAYDDGVGGGIVYCCSVEIGNYGCDGSNITACARYKMYLQRRIDVYTFLIETITERHEAFEEMWVKYTNRKAMPFSNKPKLLEDTHETSLINVKSVTRLPIRGSRYEVFPRQYNIKTKEFENVDYLTPNHFGHPWYDRKFAKEDGNTGGAYVTKDYVYYPIQYLFCSDIGGSDPSYQGYNPCWMPTFEDEDISKYNYINPESYWHPDHPFFNGIIPQQNHFKYLEFPKGYSNPWTLETDEEWDEEAFVNRMNIYAIDVETSKPAIIKSWELASYVRVEFETPINESFLEKFPYGIQNAGDEYYAPYLLMVNKMAFPGSSNKQIYILGQDPYGFDIAVKNNATYDGTLVKDVELYPDPNVQESVNPFYTHHQQPWDDDSPEITTSPMDLERNELIELQSPTFMSYVNHQSPILGSSGYLWYSADWYDFSFDWRLFGKTIAGVMSNPEDWFRINEDFAGISGGNGISGGTGATGGSPNPDTNMVIDWQVDKNFDPTMMNIFKDTFKEDWAQAFNQRWLMQYPELREEDIWRLDQTGKSLYGIMTPPQKYNVTMPDGSKIQSQEDWNPDRNFAAQFIVVGSGGAGAKCPDHTCSHDMGNISSAGCPEDFPWCNCPNQELIPGVIIGGTMGGPGITGEVMGLSGGASGAYTKPTPEKLKELLTEAKHCNLVSEHLGEDWLGCMWSDLENPNSCACPGVGENFHKYIEYMRTHSTYWSTPDYAPLYRDAQMNLIQSQRAKALVSGNLSLRPGDTIKISNKNSVDSKFVENSRAGMWMIESISHLMFNPNEHTMSLKLMRDGSNVDTNKQGFINGILRALGLK